MQVRFKQPFLVLVLALLLALLPPSAGAAERQGTPSAPGGAWGSRQPEPGRPALSPDLARAIRADRPLRVIVELADEPLATYRGGGAGLAGPAPGRGDKLDFDAPAARAYARYLAAKRADFQRRLAQVVPTARAVAEYDVVLNALAVQLQSGEDLARLLALPGIASVAPETVYRPDMNRSNAIINAPTAWSALGGQERAGEGVMVGVIDTGIDITLGSGPHPCFDGAGYTLPAGFPKGDARYTNNKVIVARVFNPPGSSFDPSDQQGHGSHTAGTIGCNAGSPAPLLPPGQYLSGVAPRVYLGNYNVFPGDVAGVATTELLSAIQAAVLDGMDVINLSLGGVAGDPTVDPVAKAVNNAVRAGVVAVVSAGNSGPTAFTIGSPGTAPGAITVGATTNNHFFGVPVRVTSSGWTGPNPIAAGKGPGLTATIGPAEIEDWAALFPSDPIACQDPTPPGSELAGKIALIQRGVCARSLKVANAVAHGAIATILINDGPGDPDTMDGLGITTPAIMVSADDGTALRAYIAANPAASVQIEPTVSEYVTPNGDLQAVFSSVGPTVFDHLIKPDVAAPGTNIYSAFQDNDPATGDPSGFASLAGTSMAAPHVAGAAALLRQRHPDWPPAAIKSALTGTARLAVYLDDDRTQRASVMQIGGGRIDLAAALDAPILSRPTSVSFGRNDVSRAAVNRSQRIDVRDLTGFGGTWTVTVVPTVTTSGMSVTVDRSTLALAPNQAASFVLRAAAPRNAATGDSYGYVELTNGPSSFQIPYWVRTSAPKLAGHSPTPIGFGVTLGDTRTGRSLVSEYSGQVCPGLLSGLGTCIGTTGPTETGPEKVYALTVSQPRSVLVLASSPSSDVSVAILSHLDEGTVVGYDDSYPAGGSSEAAYLDAAGKGHTYYIVVDSSDAGGPFTLTVLPL